MSSKTSPQADDISKKALSLKDKTICEALKEDKEKRICISSVDDSVLADQASAQGDISLCAKVNYEEYKKACELGATSKQRKKESTKQENEKFQLAQSGDSIEPCDALQDVKQKTQCKTSVISKLAYDKKDPKICDQIEDKDFRDMCLKDANSAN